MPTVNISSVARLEIPRWLLWCLMFAVALGAVWGALVIHDYAKREQDRRIEHEICELAELAVGAAFMSDAPLRLPEGDARDLLLWMETQYYPQWQWAERGYPGIMDRQRKTFRDPWGRELVYTFPSPRPAVLFDLYSMGPNGKDEGGGGDDITCGQEANIARMRLLFKGPIDPEWVKANLGRLERDPRDRRLIGHGPTNESSPGPESGPP